VVVVVNECSFHIFSYMSMMKNKTKRTLDKSTNVCVCVCLSILLNVFLMQCYLLFCHLYLATTGFPACRKEKRKEKKLMKTGQT